MSLYVIRHTKVAVEPGVCYGQSDVLPAKSFNAEKEKIAPQINNVRFERIYCSPLSRCKILAENLFEKETVIFDDRLKELNFGDWEMNTWEDIYSKPEGRVWMDNYQTLPTKNGESYPEMVKRVQQFLVELKLENAGNIAIVTHAGVIRILKHLIEGVAISELFESFKPAYGSVTKFKV